MIDPRVSMFAARAVFDLRLNATDIRVLGVFGANLSGQGWGVANQARIAESLGVKRPTINASIKRLVACDYLEMRGRIGGKGERITSLYRVRLDTPEGAELLNGLIDPPVSPTDRGCQPSGQAQDVVCATAKQTQDTPPPVSPTDTPCQPRDTAREEDILSTDRAECISIPRGKRADKKTRFDRRWTSLAPGSREYASKHDFLNGSADALFEDFRTYHMAKGSVMADWQAAWRMWVRNAVKFRERQSDERNAGSKRNDPNANRRARYGAVARVLEARRLARGEGKPDGS